jgi:hypothetical protein
LTGVLDQTSVARVLCCEEVVTGILHCAAVVIEASAVQVATIHPWPAEQSSIVSSILVSRNSILVFPFFFDKSRLGVSISRLVYILLLTACLFYMLVVDFST